MPSRAASKLVLLLLTLLATLSGRTAEWDNRDGFRFKSLTSPLSGRLADARPVRPSGARAGFTALPVARTGITFSNTLPVRLMMENNNLMNGSGVAAGDFDGDGWCDLYFCAINGTNALYHNLGDWRFADVTATAGVGCANLHCTGALWADADGDGDLDLLVATLGLGPHAFRNEGGGRFREITVESGLASQTGSTSLAMADVDGDGDLDLYVANYGAISILRSGGRAEMKLVNGQWTVAGPYANRLRFVDGRLEELGEPDVLYLNDGAAHFQPVSWNSDFFLDPAGQPMTAPWDFGLTVQMRDINGDGFPDIYVCNDFQTVDRIWINNGRGRFRALPRLAMRKQSFSSMGVDFADIDRDGFLDFLTTEMTSRHHARRLREVAGMQPVAPFPGRMDNRPEVARNTLFRNRGDGTYAEIANFSGVQATDWSWQAVFLDVDLDGYEDILVGNGMPFDVQDRDTLSRIRSFGRQTPEQSQTNLALYPPFLTPNVAFRNQRDLTFEDVSQSWGFDSTQVSQSFALADFDQDGDLDVVLNCLNANPLVYRNDATTPRIAVRLKGLPPNRAGIGAMIRVLGGPVPVQMQEILCGGHYLSGDEPMRVFAAGSVTNPLTLEVTWRSGKRSRISDARADRLYELDERAAGGAPPFPSPAKPSPLFRDVSVLLNHVHPEALFNDYARQPLLMKQFSQLGPGVAWFDLDADGHDELMLGTGKGGTVAVFRRAGSDRFEPWLTRQPWPAPDDFTGLAGWTSSDGHRALLAALASYESDATNLPPVIRLSVERAPGEFSLRPLADVPPVRASAGPLAVADLDGDGDLDVFVGGRLLPGAYPQAAASRVFRQDNGRLEADTANNRLLAELGLVSGAVWSDLDGDGYPELVLACEWGSVRVFQNDHGQLRDDTTQLGLASLTGWWNGVTTGDLDEDGRLDLIVSNWGLNDGYRASAEHPLPLFFGDLAGRGVVDLVEAYYSPELNTEVPRRSLNALSQAFPGLLEAYPNHRAFSTASVADLFRVVRQKPQALSAVTLFTTLFLNRGTRFIAVPLPAEAQFAPAFAVNVADADGDGHEDVFLSQNFFATRPEWPRLDGGRALWLRGNGTGQLTPIPGQESGVQVYGEQRGAAVGDFNEDGRVDLVVSQNGAATCLYENVGARPGLRVRLEGSPANPVGIGAIVRLQFGSRLGPARELHAGSGYWSQDSLVQVLGCPEPPTRIHVLWPGGKKVAADIPPGSREITVDVQGRVRDRRKGNTGILRTPWAQPPARTR